MKVLHPAAGEVPFRIREQVCVEPLKVKRGETRERDIADSRAGVEAHQPFVPLVGLRAHARLGVLEPRGGRSRPSPPPRQHLHGSRTLALVRGTGKRFSCRVGRETADPSCCHRTALVDETAEQVSSTDFIGGTGRHFLF